MRRSWPIWGLAIALVVLAGIWLGGGEGAVSSALSRDARGWLATQRYLAGRGTAVELRDRPLTAEIGSQVLVLAFPWQQPLAGGELEALGGFLRRGGTVLLAYSGEIGRFQEEKVFDALQLLTIEVRSAPPLAPLPWWRYHNETWNLEPADDTRWPDLALGALRGAPEAPPAARVLYRAASGTPLIFDYPLHRGRVVALPADVLANAWLGEAGNADLLESLRDQLAGGWSFDEYHHGLVAIDQAATESSSRFAWDLFIVHLALIYLLGLAALGRRFGPVWREAPVASGSAASFLRGLGALHLKMAHHREAAQLLIERARSYLPGLSLDATFERRAAEVDGDQDLVLLAREVTRAAPEIAPLARLSDHPR